MDNYLRERLRLLALRRGYREGGAPRDLGGYHQPQPGHGAWAGRPWATSSSGRQQSGHEPIKIVLQVPLGGALPDPASGRPADPVRARGFTVPLRELGRVSQRAPEEDIIYHKDLRARGVSSSADVGGRLAAPVYAMFQVQDLMAATRLHRPGRHQAGRWRRLRRRLLLARPAAGQRPPVLGVGAASGPSPTRPSATWAPPSWWPWC